jgi:hypothetical protein
MSRTSGDPAEQIVQPGTERHEFLAEPVNRNVGVIQFLGGLLAGREKKDQCWNKPAVGDVDSFLGAKASVESRSGG